jgi:hypothetical protein
MSTAGPQHVTAALAQYGTGVLALSGHSDRRSSRPQTLHQFGASGPAELESAFAAMWPKTSARSWSSMMQLSLLTRPP